MDMVDVLSKIGSINKIMVFGSVAKGTEKKGSDIDIAIELMYNPKKLTNSRFQRVCWEIENIAGIMNKKYRSLVEPGDKPFHLINLSAQKISSLRAYKNSNFFTGSKVLLDRDSFDLFVESEKINIKYSDFDLINVPLSYQSSSGIIMLAEEDEKKLYLEVPFILSDQNKIKFYCIEDDSSCFRNYYDNDKCLYVTPKVEIIEQLLLSKRNNNTNYQYYENIFFLHNNKNTDYEFNYNDYYHLIEANK